MKDIIKKYKEIFIAVSIIAIVIIIQIINMSINSQNQVTVDESKEKYNDDSNIIQNEENVIETVNQYTVEEIAYSMQKGDVFAKLGNIVVYVNDFDNSIYVFNIKTKEYKKICTIEDGISKIYFDGEYIYTMPHYYRGKGIYKIDLSGNSQKIYEGASIQLWITDDKIYFVDQIGYDQINGTPQGNLCLMDKNGENKQIVIENVKNYFYIVDDNIIYYIDQNSRSIYKANIDGTEKVEIAKGRNYITSATDKYLTYIDYSDGEKQRIIYFDNEQNDEVGRFGSVYNSIHGTYFYTRKLLDSNNNIENNYTLFSVDLHNNAELEYWTSDEVNLDWLAYVYNDYCYFRGGSNYYRVNVNNKNKREELEFGHSFFIDGIAYGVKSVNGEITEFYIYNLDDMSKETIK
ncbi:MAG: DUF5050 domain-containing protein [Clostridia bacterium]|jgi:hypothetical protein|nr:DUF5050 domain-containing protein [Clostridia bacterium]